MNTEIESAIKNFTKKSGVVAQSAGKAFAHITEKEKNLLTMKMSRTRALHW